LGINEAMKSRKSLVTLRSKAIYSTRFINHFDRAMEIATALYNRDNSSENFSKLLWITDQSKSATLKDMLKGKSDLKLGLSEEMIAREMDLKSQINFLEQTIYKSDITKSVQSDNKDETEAQRLIEVKADFTELLNEMRIKHPHYYSIMYGKDLGNGAEYSEQLIYQKKIGR